MRGNMAAVGTAAAAQHPDRRKLRLQLCVEGAEFLRTPRVELARLVQFGVAHARRVGADAAEAAQRGAAGLARRAEVRRVGAVDHEVGGAGGGLGIDIFDRLPQRLAARQPAVGLDGEGDRHRQVVGGGGPDDPDRLGGVGQGVGADHVGSAGGEDPDLLSVVLLGFSRRHLRGGAVGVATRPERAADRDRGLGPLLGSAGLLRQTDRSPVGLSQLLA